MANLLAELKRRHIYRVAAAYAVVAWVLLQLFNNVTPILESPPWVGRVILLLLVMGFPVAILLAWVRELAPADGTAGRAVTNKLDWVLIGALIVVIVGGAYQQFAPTPGAGTAVRQEAGVETARQAAASPKGAISIAVLPFTNMSGDATQEFFSDGMTEEITSALAKVPELRVVARTSAFEFKGKNVNIKTMGSELGATHLIEGSVRKAGNRIRITAQLIKADDGTHIWAEDYDRELMDVFAIQEDIARAITASLRMPLGLKPGENLVNNRAVDPASYEKFLRARAIIDSRGSDESYAQAESLLSEAVAKNPDYAPALTSLGGLYFLMTGRAANASGSVEERRARVDELRAKGEALAQRAIRSDPNSGRAYSMMAVLTWSRSKLLEADQLYANSLALDPVDYDGLGGYGIRLGEAGRLKDALAYMEKAHAVEPVHPVIAQDTASDLWLNGQNDSAVALAKTLRPADRAPLLARIYASMGRFGDAADALMEIASDPNSDAAKAASLLRTAPAKTASPEKLPRLPQNLAFVYLYVGAPGRVIDPYERTVDAGYLGGNQVAFVWHPSYAPVRKTVRFKALARKAGLVDYWRARGWPDLCRPIGTDDFVCD
jgi:TolB-like protein